MSIRIELTNRAPLLPKGTTATFGISASGRATINLYDKDGVSADFPRAGFYQNDGKILRIFAYDSDNDVSFDMHAMNTIIKPSYFLYETITSKFPDKGGIFLLLFCGEHVRRQIPLLPMSAFERVAKQTPGDPRSPQAKYKEYFAQYAKGIAPTGLEFELETGLPVGAQHVFKLDWLLCVINILLPWADDSRVHAHQERRRQGSAAAWAAAFRILSKMVLPMPPRAEGNLTWDDILSVARLPREVGGDGRLVGQDKKEE